MTGQESKSQFRGQERFEALMLPLAITAGVCLAVGFVLQKINAAEAWKIGGAHVGVILIWISLVCGAIPAVASMLQSLLKLKIGIDVLMVVGAGLAAAIGHPADGALLLFLFTLAHALEHRALAKAKEAVARLNELMPTAALKREDDAWVPVDPATLQRGDIVLVRPGDTVPADGIVLAGQSSLDQSTLTGESLPRNVTVDDEIYAGTTNQDGSLEVQVTRPVGESSLHRILNLVLEAQERRQPIQRVIDRFSTPYTMAVFAAAILVGAGWVLWGEDHSVADAVYRAITLLIVASPCALVIATPTATLCGLNRAARAGVLIKGGDALERLAMVDRVALDKTGTLTTGVIEVTHVHPIAASNPGTLLRIATGVEEHSTHPIATAIIRQAQDQEIKPATVATIANVPGSGVEGEYEGKPVRIGSFPFCESLISVCFRAHTEQIMQQTRASGGLPVCIAHDDGAMVLALTDQPRPGAEELTSQLKSVGVDEVAMLTGDHPDIAKRLADELGIEKFQARLLPEDKVEHLEKFRQEANGRGGLAVVGDGINDAPALAVADVGLAMGCIGADAALETADVVLLHDDLSRVPWSIGLAQRAKRIMHVNLTFAVLVIAFLATLTVVSGLPMSLGVLGHEGSTLIVVANSLRLLLHRGAVASSV